MSGDLTSLPATPTVVGFVLIGYALLCLLALAAAHRTAPASPQRPGLSRRTPAPGSTTATASLRPAHTRRHLWVPRRSTATVRAPGGVAALVCMLDESGSGTQTPSAAQATPGTVTAITTPVPASLNLPGDTDGYCCSITAVLDYDAEDPLAVTLSFTTESAGEQVHTSVVFARSLLSTVRAEGLAGEGAVRMRLKPGQISLSAQTLEHGDVLVLLPAVEVMAFLARSHEVVPEGSEGERLDLDAGLARLLSEFGA